MGASTFMYLHKGSQPLQEAFNIAHAQDAHENGHRYSGTLGSKGSVTLIQRTPLSPSAAEALADKLIEASDPRIDDKWGPAGAIPLTDEPVPTSTRTERITVIVTSKNNDLSSQGWVVEAIRAAAMQKIRTRKGEKVTKVRLPSHYERTDLPEIKIETRVKAATVPGKAVTRYIVTESGREVVTWEKGYTTLAEARAKVTEYAANKKTSTFDHDNVYGIHAVTRRDTDSPLVTVTRETIKATAEVDVIIGTFAPVEDKPHTGWLFFGWASS